MSGWPWSAGVGVPGGAAGGGVPRVTQPWPSQPWPHDSILKTETRPPGGISLKNRVGLTDEDEV